MRTSGKTNIVTARRRSRVGVVLATLSIAVFGTGCTSVSCEWSSTSVSDAGGGTMAGRREGPCRPAANEPPTTAEVSIVKR